MLVKDFQELTNARIRIVELPTYNVLARSWTKKGLRKYADREIKIIGTTTIIKNGVNWYPVINIYI